MSDEIISLSERGQLTIPKTLRKKFNVNRFICHVENNKIILEPLQTKEEFLAELDEIEKDWEKNGGHNLSEMKKKYKL